MQALLRRILFIHLSKRTPLRRSSASQVDHFLVNSIDWWESQGFLARPRGLLNTQIKYATRFQFEGASKMESIITGSSSLKTMETLYPITHGRQTEIAESDLNKIFTTTAASLSLIGTLVIFITFIMWPDLRTNSRRMIVFISIGDFFVALFNIIGIYNPPVDNSMCKIQPVVTNVAVLSSFLWTLNLSFYFYLTICRKISVEYERRIMQLLHLIGWGIPILISFIAFTAGAYGFSKNVVTSGWCWVSGNQEWWKVVMWMFITGKGWEIMSYICILYFYLLVILQIRREVCSRLIHLFRFHSS